MKISQSLIKDLKKYFSGQECGNLITYKWVDGNLLPPTKAMLIGQYVEFLITGVLPKDGKIPQPEYQKDGKTLYADWRKAYDHAMRAKDVLKDMGIEFVSVGKRLTKGRHEGTIDIIARATKDIQLQNGHKIKAGEMFVIDIKYSGLLDDKYNVMGWVMTEDQMLYHGVQATEYHFITDLPFTYFVIGANGTLETTTTDIKFFLMHISEQKVKDHLAEANDLMEKFEFEKKIGFEARPEYNRCCKCPIREGCKDRMTVPQIEIVEI